MGSVVKISDGSSIFEGYLATPGSDKGAGVIVIQEWWGLNDQIKVTCDRFAAEGFCALAPDLYGGDSTIDPDLAGRLMMSLTVNETQAKLNAAIQFLLEHEQVVGDQVGVVGYCMGGQLALYAAGENEKIAICADFYGIHPEFQPNFGRIRAKVLGFFGGKDHLTTPEEVEKLESKLTEAGVDYEFITFEDAQHAFTNEYRPEVYDANATLASWNVLLDQFRRALNSS